MKVLAIVLLSSLSLVALAPSPTGGRQLLPHDEAAEVSDLAAVRTVILDALDRADFKTVAKHSAPQVQAYYDAIPGRKELIRCLREEGLARSMAKALRAGGSYLEWISGVDSMAGSES